MSDTQNHSLNESLLPNGDARNISASRSNMWIKGVMLLVVLGAVGSLVGITLSSNYSKYSEPDAYYVKVNVTLPYSNLVENIEVYHDKKQGIQRISYYGGTNLYINNASGISYAIIPEFNKKTCYFDHGKNYNKTTQIGAGTPLLAIVPVNFTTLFSHVGSETVRGIKCKKYQYKNNSALGDTDGYFGNYTFYVSSKDSIPVQLKFIGHNIFFGGSHVDEYVIDYYDYRKISSDDLSEYVSPMSISQCKDRRQDGGPKILRMYDHDIDMMLPHGHEKKREKFEDYKDHFDHTFDESEDQFRQNVFHSNLRHIRAVNRLGKTYTLAPNHMTHMTEDEMKQLRGNILFREPPVEESVDDDEEEDDDEDEDDDNDDDNDNNVDDEDDDTDDDDDDDDLKRHLRKKKSCKTVTNDYIKTLIAQDGIPDAVDYLNGPVKIAGPPGDQATCGSCWSFAAAGAIESAYARITGEQVNISTQNIMDCAWGKSLQNMACDGGDAPKAFEWAMKRNKGRIATVESYPYLSQNGYCHYDRKRHKRSKEVRKAPLRVTGCGLVTERSADDKSVSTKDSVNAFMYMLALKGPLAISINASPKDFYFYREGIFSSEDCLGGVEHLDHAVLAVAYNASAEHPYMILKNSWSTHWGENGFARVSLNENICGFATAPVYVHVKAE